MTTIVTRAGKGSPLTHDEGDANFTNLNTDKIEELVSDTTPQLGGDLDLNGSALSVENTGATSVLQAAGGSDMLTTSRGAGADTGTIALTSSTTTLSIVSGVGNLGLTTPTSFDIVLTAPSGGIDISGSTSGIVAAPRIFFSETTADTDRTDEHQLYAKADNELYWKKDGDTEVAISTSGGGVNAHNLLTGLTADDHVRYADIQTVGAGAPGSTPSREGNIAIDTTDDLVYVSTDTSGSGDWTKLLVNADVVGAQEKYIPVTDMQPAAAAGCAALASAATSAGRPDIIHMAFDASTEEHAQFQFMFPKRWDLLTITARFFWVDAAVAGVADCVWGIEALAIGDNDSINAVYGTAMEVTDTSHNVASDLMITANTSALTVGGTPADGDLVNFQVYRKAADVADTLTGDAQLLGVTLTWTSDAVNDA